MKLIVVTTARTFEFAVPNTHSANNVNLEIIDDLTNDKFPYIVFDYPLYYDHAEHPVPINKVHIISWYITKE